MPDLVGLVHTQTQGIGRVSVQRIQHEVDRRVNRVGRQGQAGGALGDFKKHAVIGLEQARAYVELARDRAKIHHTEDLSIGGFVATPQVHSQGAIQYRRTTDIDLIVKPVTGAGRGTADFDQQGTAGMLGERRDVLHPWRIARADHTSVEQVDIQHATATQNFIGSHPQRGVHEARLQRHFTHVKQHGIDCKVLRRSVGCRVGQQPRHHGHRDRRTAVFLRRRIGFADALDVITVGG